MAQYQHYIPQFLLRNFSHPYKPSRENGSKKKGKSRADKGKHRGDKVLNVVDLTSDEPQLLESPVSRWFGQEDMYKDVADAIKSSFPFGRLVRFENERGEVKYGEVASETLDSLVGSTVEVYTGDFPWDPKFQRSGKKEVIYKVVAPLPRVPIFVCVGLNYKAHAAEAQTKPPENPILFNKPAACLAGPTDDILVHKDAHFLDYEGELCVVIGKTCKNLSENEDPLDYVLGYTIGNDVSSRYWQLPDRSGQQAGYAKSFDKFAPIGPIICSTAQIPAPDRLTLVTCVNGVERQRSGIDDMIFNVQDIVRFASRGHTLEPGTVIMTGTPSGVAAFIQPPAWLQNGDIVEVKIDGIGKICNRMVFEN